MKARLISENIVKISAPAAVAQWIEHWPANRRVSVLIPSQGAHTPELRARSPAGRAQETTTHRCFSPSLLLSKNKQK